MAQKRGGLTVLPGLRGVLSVATDGVNFVEIAGGSSMAHTPGSREASTVPAFEGVASVLGTQTIEPVTFELSSFLPQTDAMRKVAAAFDGNDIATFRFDTAQSRVVGARDTAAVGGVAFTAATTPGPVGGAAVSGTASDVTTPFTDNTVERGMVFAVDKPAAGVAFGLDDIYIIEGIDVNAAGTLTAFAPATATGGITVTKADVSNVATVVAATFEVYVPSIRIQFAARVENLPGFNIGAGADEPLSGTLTVRPTSPIGLPTLNVVSEA